MKIHLHIKIIFAAVLVLLMMTPFVSCNEDDKDGLPVIYQVRTTDPGLKDSTLAQGVPAQMLLIEGENLGSTRKIFINDQEIYFNPNYVTSQHIIITIPEDLELTGTNPELPREIRVETTAGSATYNFHVLSPPPEVLTYVAEYPVKPGDYVLVYGQNFYEIEKIIFEGEEGTDAEATEYTVNKAYNAVTIKLPADADAKGELVIHCAAGEVSIAYSTTVLAPVITTFSTEMPVVGADFFITGKYFVHVEKVNINGEYDIPANNLRVSETNDTIYLKLPAAPVSSGVITVTAAGGNSKDRKLFYPIEDVILDYDKVGSFNWGEGKVIEGDGIHAPFVTTGKAGGIVETNIGAWNYWFGNLINFIQFTDNIAENLPVTDLSVRFECFVTYPLETISLEVMFAGDWDHFLTGYVPKSMVTGTTETGQWMTCEIPLSDLVVDAKTYGDVKAMGAEMGFFSKNLGDGVANYEIYFDNIRIAFKNNFILLK